MSWCSYYEKHGILDVGRRIDRSLAYISSMFAQSYLKFKDGHKPTPNDFTLYPVEVEEDKPASIDDIANLLRSTAIKG